MSDNEKPDDLQYIKQTVSEIRDSLNKKNMLNKVIISFYIVVVVLMMLLYSVKQTPAVSKVEKALEKSNVLGCSLLANNATQQQDDNYE
ncbi:MAG: hypothetical protein KGJ07_00090 [Patescibacteria group bacterium]|nr:hypothetical protein [Patescibacteria group bacterium]